MSDFAIQYLTLEPAERDRFTTVVARLMRGEFVTPGSPLRPDADWRFVERHAEVIDQYLSIGGWRLEFQPERQIARVIHPEGAGRVQLDRLTTACLILLRRSFHEQMGSFSAHNIDSQAVAVTVSDVREQLSHAGWKSHQVSRRLIELAIRALHRAQIVVIERGFVADDRETIEVMPVIESVLPIRDIRAMQEYIRRFVETTGAAGLADGDVGAGLRETTEDVGARTDGAGLDRSDHGENAERPVSPAISLVASVENTQG